MKKETINSVTTILRNKICCGCGACAVICPTSCISIVYGERYNFPHLDFDRCQNCGLCLKVCPSAFLLKATEHCTLQEPTKGILECFLIHSQDEEIRLGAASGGFITGIILHLMENGHIDGGVVVKTEGKNPLVAESFIATNREALLSARGSKYAPVSNCTALVQVLERPGRYVFVGTPCMVEGLTKLQKFLPALKERIILKIGMVCAGMASRLATRRYIEKDGGVKTADVRRICYRGSGWPGRFQVFGENGLLLMDRPLIGGSLTHLVGHDHYLRCHNCLDHWSSYADIVVSDPWSHDIVKNESKGRSAIMVRTEQGRMAVASAIESGDMVADSIPVEEMYGFNLHLVINSKHERHSWMALYQFLFLGRIRYFATLARRLFNLQLVGLRTTIKARLSRNYYY